MIFLVVTKNQTSIQKSMIIYLVGYDNNDSNFDDLKEIFGLFRDRIVNYATFYSTEDNPITIRDSPLPRLLKSHNVPFYRIQIPEKTRMFYNEKIQTIKKYMKKDQEEYDLLVNKNCARGRYLKFWNELYQKELMEIKKFFELKIKPVYIAESILEQLEGILDENLLLLHFGEIQTFGEIMKTIKLVNSKIDISYLHYMS